MPFLTKTKKCPAFCKDAVLSLAQQGSYDGVGRSEWRRFRCSRLFRLDSKGCSLLKWCAAKSAVFGYSSLSAEGRSRELKAVLLISATPPRIHRVISSATFSVGLSFILRHPSSQAPEYFGWQAPFFCVFAGNFLGDRHRFKLVDLVLYLRRLALGGGLSSGDNLVLNRLWW